MIGGFLDWLEADCDAFHFAPWALYTPIALTAASKTADPSTDQVLVHPTTTPRVRWECALRLFAWPTESEKNKHFLHFFGPLNLLSKQIVICQIYKLNMMNYGNSGTKLSVEMPTFYLGEKKSSSRSNNCVA